MKTLDEFNSERKKEYKIDGQGIVDLIYSITPVKNGIACNRCGNELFDSDPDEILTSSPPKKSVHCGLCGFRGYRIA